MYTCIYVYLHICIYACMYIYIYMYICIYVCMYICMYVYIHIYVYMYMYICICTWGLAPKEMFARCVVRNRINFPLQNFVLVRHLQKKKRHIWSWLLCFAYRIISLPKKKISKAPFVTSIYPANLIFCATSSAHHFLNSPPKFTS